MARKTCGASADRLREASPILWSPLLLPFKDPDLPLGPAGNANAPAPNPLTAPAVQTLRLSKGPIAGLVVGCVAAVALTFTAALFFVFQVRAPQQPSPLQHQLRSGSRHC